MRHEIERELTTLEYLVLGLTAQEPQSGYSIISTFESDWYRWSASPGSIYPILKRLEKQDILLSELEVIHETRSRKMYRPTPLGLELLEEWLKSPLTNREMAQERDIIMMKFLFMEKIFELPEILAWLDAYRQALEDYKTLLQINFATDPEVRQASLHHHLILEATTMEMDMQLRWIALARKRLQASA